MPNISPLTRGHNYYKRNSARLVFKKPLVVDCAPPIVSFTFDDFPRTALFSGGEILRHYRAAGTYYVALGLLGKESPSGPICTAEDLHDALRQGHELGCHTYGHCHSWNTGRREFAQNVLMNREALEQIVPHAKFRSLSYPISEPRPLTKLDTGKQFLCCRAGGQTFNSGKVDLNQLAAFFLEQSLGGLEPIFDLIDRNQVARGWLIFATHDVCPNPSRYGCTPEFFEKVVRYASESGARILPVAEACMALRKQRAAEKVAS
jgi:peptidoglycan/xylan/chitin deacetylase (PgdA/CDA1 family)